MQLTSSFRRLSFLVAFLAATAFPAYAQAPNADATAAASVVAQFHASLEAGDESAIARLLAADAVVLESGARETRKEYFEHHLQADIQFARAVRANRSDVQVVVSGDIAWVSSVSVTRGTFEKRPINLKGAELMVLSRSATGWVIRAIHWSSRKAA